MSTRRLWIIFSVFTTCLSFPSNERLSRGRDGCAVGGAVGTAACEGSAPRSAARRAWALISSTGRRMSARRLRIIFSVVTVSVSSTRAARLRRRKDGGAVGGAVGTAPRAGLCEEAEAAGAAGTRVSTSLMLPGVVCGRGFCKLTLSRRGEAANDMSRGPNTKLPRRANWSRCKAAIHAFLRKPSIPVSECELRRVA